MRITGIRERTVSVAGAVRNAAIGFAGMTASALVIATDARRGGKPVFGIAFDSIGRYGHGGLLRERFIPRLLAAAPDAYCDATGRGVDPLRAFDLVMRDEKPGGHGERPGAVGLIDAALWDLAAKLEDKPLWAVLAARFGTAAPDAPVAVYASGGHYREGDDLAQLRTEIERHVAAGYTRVKIKVGGAPLAHDLRRIETALDALRADGSLAVDCNAALPRERALAFVDALAAYPLAWIEEPADPLDFALLAEVAARCALPLGTGENLFSAADVLNLLRYGGLRPDRDILQMDISLSYGLTEYLKILGTLEAHGWSRRQCVPHAGHLFAFNVVAGLGLGGHETAPSGVFAPRLPVERGMMRPDDAPGVG